MLMFYAGLMGPDSRCSLHVQPAYVQSSEATSTPLDPAALVQPSRQTLSAPLPLQVVSHGQIRRTKTNLTANPTGRLAHERTSLSVRLVGPSVRPPLECVAKQRS